jgi:hypothetical protein
MLYTKDVYYYMDYLKEQDKKCARKYMEESHPCSTTLFLSHLTIKIRVPCPITVTYSVALSMYRHKIFRF